MTVEVNEVHGTHVIALDGEIDLQTSPEVRAAILRSLGGGAPVVVDLGAVAYIDSSGVASLVEGYQTARGKSLAFSLAAVPEGPMRVLKLARLDKIFVLHPDVESALRAGG